MRKVRKKNFFSPSSFPSIPHPLSLLDHSLVILGSILAVEGEEGTERYREGVH